MNRERIYYYKYIAGDGVHYRFSSGTDRHEAKAGEYLRMLRYAKKEAVCLYPDNATDYETICLLFNIKKGTPWQDIYFNKL